MYADDTTLHTHDINKEEIERKLNHDANTISKWYLNNKMVINSSMLVGTNQERALIGHKLIISIPDNPITSVETQKFLDFHTLPVEIKGNVTGLHGGNGIEIECSYTKQNFILITVISFLAFNRSSITYNEIAIYVPNSLSYLTDNGQYLKGRVTLMNITQSTTRAVMTFNEPKYIDDTLYQCRVNYIASSGVKNTISNSTTISVQDTHALSVELLQDVRGLYGENGTELECSYTKQNVILIISISFLAFNRSSIQFNEIAIYVPNSISYLTDDGQYLGERVTLMNITQSTTKAVMTFNKPMCIDETFYQCKVNYIASSGVKNIVSNNSSISVQVQPSVPDVFLLLNAQIKSTPGITDGDNVTFVCSGDVGRPPRKLIFQKYQRDHSLLINYTATNTSIQEFSENCSYYRTSYITFMVTSDDNTAVIRCAVVSTLAAENMYVESEPLDVNYSVKVPTIVKHPNKTDYLVGVDTSISLNCVADGNPKPNYLWYKDNQIEAISTSGNLTFTNVTTANSGIYTCVVSNNLNDVISTKRVLMYLSIIKEVNKTPIIIQSYTENTVVIAVGAVCGSIILTLCVILFSVIQNKYKTCKCLLVRTSHDRSADYVNTTQQQHLSLFEGVGRTLDVHNYEQIARTEHLYNNTNLRSN
ncbi:unnamed protein product [Mytilus coruscus]|uniref:Ig-like domain-containing protein n=1 Tax=Mytilus coruscus TaxID=42192 RepID=A0A6J8DF09_MYTCO|nr:unnamed protein product [Mytilus coruscus]